MPTGDGGLVSIIGILSVFVGRRPPKPGRTARRGGTYDMNARVLQRALTHLDSNLAACQLVDVGSTSRCNTGVKSLRWGFECQSLTWPFVELTSHFVQISLRMHRQVGSFGKYLGL